MTDSSQILTRAFHDLRDRLRVDLTDEQILRILPTLEEFSHDLLDAVKAEMLACVDRVR